MWALLLMVLAAQPTPTPAGPPAGPAVGPPAPGAAVPSTQPAERYDQGEMRVEMMAIREQRFRFDYPMPGRPPPRSDLQVQLRLRGSDIGKLVRAGNAFPEDATDDTGQSLILPDSNTPDKAAFTRVVSMTPEQLATNGFVFGAQFAASARGALGMKAMHGTLKVTYADAVEELVVVNPLQYAGKTIPLARLEELGIVITVVKPEKPAAEGQPAPPEIGLRIDKGAEKVRDFSFCDAYLRPLFNSPATEQKTADGKPYTSFAAQRVPFSADTQLIIAVFKNPHEETVKWNFDGLKLP